MKITARCKAFTGEGIRTHRIMVDDDGAVRVYDSIAKHYTTCHSLSARQQARLRTLAR